MNPKLLFVGCDKGAWQMRGRQIAAALGGNAWATAKPQPHHWAWADAVVLVKRAPEVWWREAKACGHPLIWDVLDFWHQPSENRRTEAEFVREVQQMRASFKGQMRLVIGATQAMATAVGGVYLPHHHRLGLAPAAIRARVEVVAYEGSERYLGSWRPALERTCAALGLRFVINPSALTQADIVVAFRDELWDGWVCREWKSGIKCVNAIVAGRPLISQASAGVRELRPIGQVIEDQRELEAALVANSALPVRHAAWAAGLRRAEGFAIETIAEEYRVLLHGALRAAA